MSFCVVASYYTAYISARPVPAPAPAPAPWTKRGVRSGRGVGEFGTADAQHVKKKRAAAVVPNAHRNSPRSKRPPQFDDLVTPQGRYPSAWATDLADIFGWDDVLEASGVGVGDGGGSDEDDAPSSSKPAAKKLLLPKRIALDGANIAWSLGTSIRSRFKCRQFPLSAGVIHALHYEPWQKKNFEVTAFLPKEYVVGTLQSLCDGGGRATLNADCVKYVGKGVWVNTHLMDLVDAGRIIMVDRGASSSATLVKASDDLTIIEYAKDRDAWICSNDQFRDHRRNKTLGFSGARDLKAFARTRRFEHGFRVAPGLDDLLLDNMRNASGWEPRIGRQAATTISGGNVPPPRPRFGDTNTKQNRNKTETDAMASVMEELMMISDGTSISYGERSSRSATESSSNSSEEEFYDGSRTRNDNENALGGVPPFYAMPQNVLPVFFEPTPTQPMIAARKSFLHRQGWNVQTVTGG